MSSELPLVGFDQVLPILRMIRAEKRVGTLYLTTADNRAASLSFVAGEIVGARFRFTRGRDALLLIKNIGLSRYAFDENKAFESDPDLPPTSEVFAILGEPSAPFASTPPRPMTIDVTRVRKILEMELGRYLGPMANVICKEQLGQAGTLSSPAELQRLVNELAEYVSDRNQADAFSRAVWNKLSG